jgi:aspartate carbamoyltransferase catalytic subunit
MPDLQRRLMHLISCNQFRKEDVERLIGSAEENRDRKNLHLQHKTIATLFYEPSTRTRMSFEAAVYRMGGNVISNEDATQSSSSAKGESLEDTIRMVSSYCDAIVLRHPADDSSERAAQIAHVPVINAGAGACEHPTQALLDLYTVWREKGKIDLCYALVGDLRYGRTTHSLVRLLGLYNVKVILVSSDYFSLPDDLLKFIPNCHKVDSIDEALECEPDVVYLTRMQRERFPPHLKRCSNVFSEEHLNRLKKDAIIMHPFPRNEELPKTIDRDKRAAYFRQSENGLWMRMAILKELVK